MKGRLPLTEEVMRHKRLSKLRFHTPGHKGKGHGVGELFQLALDLTETGELDNLLAPEGVIKRSIEKIERVLNVKKAFFITTGATTGILSAMSLFKGEKVAVLRSSHVSVYNAIELFDIRPVIIDDINSLGRRVVLTEEMIEKMLCDVELTAFVLTYPDYYGKVFDIEKISKRIKLAGKLLFVDSAHGAHLYFGTKLPPPASDFADVAVISNHKTMPTMTQGALLLCQNEALMGRLENAFHIFHTTSPSYPIMMSIEVGIELLVSSEKECDSLRKKIARMKERLCEKGVYTLSSQDYFKLIIDTERMEISGKELGLRLSERGIFCEFSSVNEVCFIITLSDEESELDLLFDALVDCSSQCGQVAKKSVLFPRGEMVLSYEEGIKTPCEYVDIEKAVGRVAARNFGVYPPCTPIMVAGERVDENIVEYINSELDFYNIKDNKILVTK